MTYEGFTPRELKPGNQSTHTYFVGIIECIICLISVRTFVKTSTIPFTLSLSILSWFEHYPRIHNSSNTTEYGKWLKWKFPLIFYGYSEYIWYIYVQWHPYCVHYKICHVPYLILAIFIFYVSIQRKYNLQFNKTLACLHQ